MSCDKFRFDINIKEITIKTIVSEYEFETEIPKVEPPPAKLENEFMKFEMKIFGQRIETEDDEKNSVTMIDGCHLLDLYFNCQNNSNETLEEDFIFDVLGQPLIGELLSRVPTIIYTLFKFLEYFALYRLVILSLN